MVPYPKNLPSPRTNFRTLMFSLTTIYTSAVFSDLPNFTNPIISKVSASGKFWRTNFVQKLKGTPFVLKNKGSIPI